MFAQRQVLRALRSPIVQRRFASTTPKPGESKFAAERRVSTLPAPQAADSTPNTKLPIMKGTYH